MLDLYDIVDSLDYITTNCYQGQLTTVLDESFNVKRLTVADIAHTDIPKGAIVLSRLKLRTLCRVLDEIAPKLQGTRVLVYEQDTWENFFPSSPWFKSYQTICDKLSVISFLNMAHWWAELVRSTGIPARFVQVWTLPKYCDPPIPWSQRQHAVIFCGTMYPRRIALVNALKDHGVDVEIVPAGKSYRDYLGLLSLSKVQIRSEKIDWVLNAGKGDFRLTEHNAMWQRDIECAARGCFSMRENDGEGVKWGIDRIPTIVPFDTVGAAATNVKRILSMDNAEADYLTNVAVEAVRSAEGWSSVPRVIHELVGM